MTRASGDEAVAVARKQTTCEKGMCLSTVQEWWASGHAYPDAQAQWNATDQHKGDRNPPIGAPVFYKGGKHGHIAIYVGKGNIRSTDCKQTYQVSEASLDWPTKAWGYSYLGWGGTLAGVRLPLGQNKGDDDLTPEEHNWLQDVTTRVRGSDPHGDMLQLTRQDIRILSQMLQSGQRIQDDSNPDWTFWSKQPYTMMAAMQNQLNAIQQTLDDMRK